MDTSVLSKEDIYSCSIFLNAALPLLKVIVESDEKRKKSFENINAIVQVSAKNEKEKVGTHYIIEEGNWSVVKGVIDTADIELEFSSIPHLNGFFSGKSKKLPRIKGIKNTKLLVNTVKLLLRMSSLLSAKEPPKKIEDRELMTKLYFYLLSGGISQLNKVGHPDVSKWAKRSPDRVYAWAVSGRPELSAYIRVKAGNTKAARGEYKRAKPFFTMRFDSVESALGTLLETDDLIKATIAGRIVMEGAPEFGAQIGDFMKLVGSYAK